MRLRADLSLFLVAIIWGLAFVVQRDAALHASVFLFNGFRFLLAACVLFPFVRFCWQLTRQQMVVSFLAGIILFIASAFQQWGLRSTSAGNAGFLTSLYVVIVPIILLIIWREKITFLTGLSVVLATTGAFFLSTGGSMKLQPGDEFELLSAVFWASHLIFLSKFVKTIPTIPFSIGQYLIAGVLNFIVGSFFERKTIGELGHIIGGIVYAGVISVGLGYTLQVAAQKNTAASHAAIILSLEAVFAALAGFLFMGEKMLPKQTAGCALILIGVILVQFRSGKIKT